MPYAVWIKEGEESGVGPYKLDGMPALPNKIAVPISVEQVNVAKFMHNVHVFDIVQGVDIKKSDEKEFVFEGKRYHYKDGLFDPPVDTKVYERMQAQKII